MPGIAALADAAQKIKDLVIVQQSSNDENSQRSKLEIIALCIISTTKNNAYIE
jgi:hypothetical protein